MAFHDVRIPESVAYGFTGGPSRRTQIVTLGGGHEERNAQWADSRREYQIGYAIRGLNDLNALYSFWEDRRGPLHAFRFKDWADYKSCAPEDSVAAGDEKLVPGKGDGTTTQFQLVKRYGTVDVYQRDITKPVVGTVRVSVAGAELVSGWSVDYLTGVVTFDSAPADDAFVKAGFEFDVPVRFSGDDWRPSINGPELGAVPDVRLIEVRE